MVQRSEAAIIREFNTRLTSERLRPLGREGCIEARGGVLTATSARLSAVGVVLVNVARADMRRPREQQPRRLIDVEWNPNSIGP